MEPDPSTFSEILIDPVKRACCGSGMASKGNMAAARCRTRSAIFPRDLQERACKCNCQCGHRPPAGKQLFRKYLREFNTGHVPSAEDPLTLDPEPDVEVLMLNGLHSHPHRHITGTGADQQIYVVSSELQPQN